MRANPSSPLLIAEHPLQVLPSLAVAIGLNEAILVQQVHYWLNNKDKRNKPYISEGRKWVYNSYSDWQEQLPFWSIPTIKRAVLQAEKLGILISEQFDLPQGDAKKYYTIEYAKLDEILAQTNATPSDQVDPTPPLPHEINLIPPSDQVDPTMGSIRSILPCLISETTQRLSTETTLVENHKADSLPDETVQVVPTSTKKTGKQLTPTVPANGGYATSPEVAKIPPTTPQNDHQRMMAALHVVLNGQKIINGEAQGKAIKKILTGYTADQAIECLNWMADPTTWWNAKADWTTVQGQIADYFRRKEQQPQTKLGGNNGKSKLWEFCNSRPLGQF